jgi:7-carboxy-7-deazaguanine synthase
MNVIDIFMSIDGEVNQWGQGRLAMFVRLAGCNLKCSYCDTPESWDMSKGVFWSFDELESRWESYGAPNKITITGGEPMLQEARMFHFVDRMICKGCVVTIETNGTIEIPHLRKTMYKSLGWVVDYKLHEKGRMRDETFIGLGDNSWVKFIVDDVWDLDVVDGIKDRLIAKGCGARFAVSGVSSASSPKVLMKGLIGRRLWDVSLNVRLHKLIGVR